MFIDTLIEKIREKDNPSVVGLDPKIEYVPSFIKEDMYKKYGKNLKSINILLMRFTILFLQ